MSNVDGLYYCEADVAFVMAWYKMNPWVKTVLVRPEVELPERWWLDAELHGGIERRVGWRDFEIKWHCVLFRDGTRGPVVYGTENNPEEWEEHDGKA